MENASKFLIMAGGILIALIVASIMVYLFSTGTVLTLGYDTRMSEAELQAYNSEFETIANKDSVSASDIASLINKAKNINESIKDKGGEPIKIEITIKDVSLTKTDWTIADTAEIGTYVLEKSDNEKWKFYKRNSEYDLYNFIQLNSNIKCDKSDGSSTVYTYRIFECNEIEYHNDGKIKCITFTSNKINENALN